MLVYIEKLAEPRIIFIIQKIDFSNLKYKKELIIDIKICLELNLFNRLLKLKLKKIFNKRFNNRRYKKLDKILNKIKMNNLYRITLILKNKIKQLLILRNKNLTHLMKLNDKKIQETHYFLKMIQRNP